MLFNSYEFIFVFLPLTFFIYFFLLQQRLLFAAKSFLVFSSLFFYSWWNIDYLPIILVSLLFNYTIGNMLNENIKKIKIHKKIILTAGITANIALLGYFKYTDFLLENFNLAFNTSVPLLHLALPLAISFFTFQQIAYLVDSYRGETDEYDFLNYALFVTFFPQLIAGPIVHHSEMMPQFASRWNLIKNYKHIALGLFLFSIGLFKKVVIADSFSLWVNIGFEADMLHFIDAWATSLSYTFQLYFDFSGYTDMAIGAALLFNIKLPINFNSPYKALSIQDFWRRWHITLSRFLKDYIYIPLGGNRHGSSRTYLNLLVTFLIGGIWHGAGWTFVFWGFLHGMALVIHRLWKSTNLHIPKILAWFITFNFINIAWIFFRAENWDQAIKVLHGMMNIQDGYIYILKLISHLTKDVPIQQHMLFDYNTLWWIISILIIVLFFKNSHEILDYPNFTKFYVFTKKYAIYFAILFLFSLLYKSLHPYSEFIYFNF